MTDTSRFIKPAISETAKLSSSFVLPATPGGFLEGMALAFASYDEATYQGAIAAAQGNPVREQMITNYAERSRLSAESLAPAPAKAAGSKPAVGGM